MIRSVLPAACLIGVLARLLSAEELPVVAPASVGFDAEKLARVRSVMDDFVSRGDRAGVTTIIARRGKIVFAESTGRASVDSDSELRSDAIVRLFSMSKPITGVAVMMLVESGKLELDDPVSKHLPDFARQTVLSGGTAADIESKPVKREMTVRDLLRHTSGLTYGIFDNTPVDQLYRQSQILDRDLSLQETVRRLGSIPLLHEPGEQFNYSVAVDVVGRVVEVASGHSFDEFLQQHIFDPLDMKDTAFAVPDQKLARFAANHQSRAGTLSVSDAPETSRFRKTPAFLSGGGGLVGTGRDYVRFCQMLLNGGELFGTRLLSKESVVEMTRNQLPKAAYPLKIGGITRPGVGFGLGFSVIAEPIPFADFVPVGEYGWGGAACTHFWISPQHETVVVVLSQYTPFSLALEATIKPVVYGAIVD